jgi:hypothetical protein
MDLIEEAIALLRSAPANAHLAYYVGAVPFWVGLLYYLSDMSQDAFAASRVLDSSLGVAVLYLWKKVWQTVSAAHLRSVLTGRPDAPWSVRRILSVLAVQASIQSWGLILRPIAAVLTLPVVWVSAFYQSVTVVGDGTEQERSVLGRALAQARLWPLQAHGIVSILSFFSFFVWLNFCLALAAGPYALKMFFGIQTEYTRNIEAYLNTTFFTASIALTSLAVDPLRKAIFVIRCFHGAALHTGEDLTAELRQIRARPAPVLTTLSMALVLVAATATVNAADPPVEKAPSAADAGELKRRISEVLERREYAWRAPRVKETSEEENSWIGKWFSGLRKKIDETFKTTLTQVGRVFRWLRGYLMTPSMGSSTTTIDWVGLAKAIGVLFGAAMVVIIGWICMRVFAHPKRRIVTATAVTATAPDLRAENLVADQLPEDGWRELARDYAARGDLVLAQRAAWLAGLAHLGHRELIGIARHKSNRDYDRELQRRARERFPLLSAFDDNLRAFERSWYGKHEVSTEGYAQFEENLDQIRSS